MVIYVVFCPSGFEKRLLSFFHCSTASRLVDFTATRPEENKSNEDEMLQIGQNRAEFGIVTFFLFRNTLTNYLETALDGCDFWPLGYQQK